MAASFASKTVMVTGGSGTIGSGIIRDILQQGATVVAPVRSEKSAQKLKDTVVSGDLERLKIKIADVSDVQQAKKLAQEVKQEHGPLNHVVSAIGAWWQKGELSEQSLEEVQKQVHNLAISHFVVYSTFLPYIGDDPKNSYTFFSGAAGESLDAPGTSLITVGAACLFGISIAARGECKDKALRVNEFRLAAFAKRDAEASPEQGVFSHFTVGTLVSQLLASERSGEVVRVGPKELKAESL